MFYMPTPTETNTMDYPQGNFWHTGSNCGQPVLILYPSCPAHQLTVNDQQNNTMPVTMERSFQDTSVRLSWQDSGYLTEFYWGKG